ncbi:Beta-2-syntrophin, partial [Nibea albiflora]
CLCSSTVKYIREVSPLFKKPSLVADLPWDGIRPQSPSYSGSEDSGSPKHSSSSSSKDRKVISPEDVLHQQEPHHAGSRKQTCICYDYSIYYFTKLSPVIRSQLEGGRQQYKPIVMALTEKDILLFESLPWSRESWSIPLLTHPLLATRLVHSGNARGFPRPGFRLVFATRTWQRDGASSLTSSGWRPTGICRRGREPSFRGRTLPAELIKEVSIGCTLNRQDVRLTLHYEKGFTVTREPADPAGGAVLFRYPYEKLKMSADDGIRNLYLDFGGPEGEMVFDLHSGPKPVVFVLHSFLSAKLTRMGLLT